jgi:exodeoxyribonuclease VII large subunit
VTDTLREVFGDTVWVEGEIAQLNRSPAGHVYITLVDPDTGDAHGARPQLSVTLFRPQQKTVERRLREAGGQVELGEGVRVRIGGTLGTYAARSTFQLRMTDLDPTFTLGVLGRERARVLAALEQDGLMDRNAGVPLATLPLRIALVTSVDSAAHGDALHELRHSGVPFTVLQFDARTQGVQAVDSLLRALRSAAGSEVDVVLLVRGGGAATDLAAFDDERVARAVATMPLPVVVGIGHEVDRSVTDEVAHRAEKTPTAAAAYLARRAGDAVARLDELTDGVTAMARRRLERASARLDLGAQRIAARTERTLVHASTRVDEHRRRTVRAVERRLERAELRLDVLGARARLHDPGAALARGWSITRTDDGTVVVDATALVPGQGITTTLARGTVHSVVGSVDRTDVRTDDGSDDRGTPPSTGATGASTNGNDDL